MPGLPRGSVSPARRPTSDNIVFWHAIARTAGREALRSTATIGDDDVERVIVTTLEETPPDATHWSTRSMAKRCGIISSSVNRIWNAFARQPHRIETFKLSKGPQFIERVRDIVGLYLSPPERAVVLCVWMRAADSSTEPHRADFAAAL